MRLILIRHGEPDLSGDLTDPPLTDLGQRQASATAAFLSDADIDAVYISPQQRAQQTSKPLLHTRRVTPITDERIAEFDYELGGYVDPATFQGMTRAEALALLNEYQGPAFQKRVLAGVNDIVEQHASQTVAVVCHGGVINMIVRKTLDSTQPVSPHHASITRIDASRSGIRSLTTFNEHHWLLGL